MWPAVVVVLAEDIELPLQLGQRLGGRLLLEEALEGLVEAFDLAASLGVVGRGVLEDDAQALELQFQDDPAPARPACKHRGVVAEERGGQSERIRSGMEDLDHVQSLEGGEGAGGQSDSGLVIEEVQDLDRAAIGQLPGCGVELPGFVGQLGLEADEGSSGSFVRLGCDEALALEDAPDAGDRWQLGNLFRQVVVDGLQTGVIAGSRQLASEFDDQVLDLGVDLVGARLGSPRAWL